MRDLSFLLPWAPLIGTLFISVAPIFLMIFQGRKLKAEVALLKQTLANARTAGVKENANAIEILERVTSTTAEELEKALEKSITLKKLKEQIDYQQEIINQQIDKISSLTDSLHTEREARLSVEEKMVLLQKELDSERLERERALAENEKIKASSDKEIRKWIARVKVLEESIRNLNGQIPSSSEE